MVIKVVIQQKLQCEQWTDKLVIVNYILKICDNPFLIADAQPLRAALRAAQPRGMLIRLIIN